MVCFGEKLDLEGKSKNRRTLKLGSAILCACDLLLTLRAVLAAAMQMFCQGEM